MSDQERLAMLKDAQARATERAQMLEALRRATNDLSSLAVTLSPGTPAQKFANDAADAASEALAKLEGK
jgi:hypothetical protein